jgi:glycosyl transferase family 87
MQIELRRTAPRWSDVAIPAVVVMVGVLVLARLIDLYPWNVPYFDLVTYWATRNGFDFATAHAGPAGAYLYSPAFAQLIRPLTVLPLPAFAAIWTAIGAALLIWMGGRSSFALLLLPPVLLTIVQGQLDLAFAAVVVAGMRWPAAWAFTLLTKVTPGVGLLWFLFRREWRSFAIAVGATLGVVVASAVLDPGGWAGWFGLLLRLDFPTPAGGLLYIPVSFWIRAPIAVAVVVWGALTDRAWTVPVAACLAMPIMWLNSPTILVGILPLVAAGATTPAGRWLRAGRALRP